MRFPNAVAADSDQAGTGLWLSQRSCELIPNDAAVRQLLKFLGFQKIRVIKAKKKGPLEFLKIPFRKGTYFAAR
jgi:hypothetical protein